MSQTALDKPFDATIVAASSPVDPTWLARGVDVLTSAGFQLSWDAETVHQRGRFAAGPPEHRWSALCQALAEHDIVFFARGGHGMLHLAQWMIDGPVDGLGRAWMVGASDATVAAAWALRNDAKFIYGPMPSAYLSREPTHAAVTALVAALRGEATAVATPKAVSICSGTAEAELVGGCLSLVAALSGSDLAFDTAGKILLLEDVGEHPFRLDRMLHQLRISGAFDEVAGVVLGTYPGCDVPDGADYTTKQIFEDFFAEAAYPVIYGWPSGHVDAGEDVDSLALGGKYRLESGQTTPKLMRL